MHVTGIAFVVYALIGFFGAADFGSNTQGNILEKTWVVVPVKECSTLPCHVRVTTLPHALSLHPGT
jgi:hypothetical protein